jgi:hypothetical protein
MANPIWKDYYSTLGTADLTYRIILRDTGDPIYVGKAHMRPGQTSNSIRINDICADFFKDTLPAMSQAEFSELDFPITFKVQIEVPGPHGTTIWQDVDTVAFDNNWSYDYGYDPETMGLSFPINGHLDPRQPIVLSVYDAEEVVADIYFTDGSTMQVTIPVSRTNDFNEDFNFDFSRETRGSASGVAVLLPSQWPGEIARVEIGGNVYKGVDVCARYALYYVNAYGGWDSFLIEGNTLETDAITRHNRMVEYDNNDISNRGESNYLNEISKGFSFTTGWLQDDESQRMHHLVNSTCVYLYDLTYGEMIPVVVTDETLEYKTYGNQGNRLVNYTLQCRIAQERIRR